MIAKIKLEGYQYLQRMLMNIQKQRILARRAMRSSFNFDNSDALACISQVKKILADILTDENRRLFGIITSEDVVYNEETQTVEFLPSDLALNSERPGAKEIAIRRSNSNRAKIILIGIMGICSIYSTYGVAIPTLATSTPLLPYAYEQVQQTATVAKQDILIPTEFGGLKGWLFKSNDSNKVVLVTHAANHNKSWEGPLYEKLTDRGYNVVSFDFLGHGENEWKFGSLSFGINETKMVLSALEYLEKLGYKEVVLVGQSMGSGSSIQAAAKYSGSMNIKGISAGAAYAGLKSSFRMIGKNMQIPIAPKLTDMGVGLGGLVAGVNFDIDLSPSIEMVNKKGIDIQYYWGENDNMISPELIQRVKNLAKPTDSIKVYKGRGHTFYYESERIERDGDVVHFVLGHMNPA